MPDLKISQLPAATTPLAGTELVPIVQSGTTDKVTVADLTAGRAVSASALTASSGNLTFSGTAQRITGDMSNATVANRLAFQTSTTDGSTTLLVIPNGTGPNSGIVFRTSSAVSNDSVGQINIVGGSDFRLNSTLSGTGTYLPMTFYTGGSERMRIDTSGNVGVGTSSPGGAFSVQRSDTSTTIGGSAAVLKVNNISGTLSSTSGIEFFATADLTVNTGRAAGIYGVYSSFNAAGIGGALVFATNTPGDATIDERMRIDSSGNVGIGTASPAFRLDVSGSGTQTVRSATVDTSGTAIGRFRAVYTGGGGGAASAVDLRAGDGYAYLLTETNSPLLFGTNAAERLRIDSSGNVVQNTAAVATNATAGFLWITSCAGAPTGAPTAPYTNAAALVCDTTNNRLYVRVGSTWRYATLT